MKTWKSRSISLLAAGMAVAALALGGCAPAEPPTPASDTAAATPPAPAPPEQVVQTVVSPKKDRQALVVKAQEKYAVRLEGLPAPRFDEILDVRFTPDGLSLLYEGRRGDAWFVVVDGQEWSQDTQVVHGSIRLSPDHQRLALVGMHEGKWQAMVDGKPGDPYDFIFADTLNFAADSRRVGYLAVKDGKVVAVVNGTIAQRFDLLKEAKQFLAKELAAEADQDEEEEG